MEVVTVKLKFVGGLSSILDKREDEVSVPKGTTVKQLLNVLGTRYGEAFRNRIWSLQGGLSSDCRVFLGQDDITNSGLDTEVKSGGITLFFLQGMAGGAL